jgi:hypothetical protein
MQYFSDMASQQMADLALLRDFRSLELKGVSLGDSQSSFSAGMDDGGRGTKI